MKFLIVALATLLSLQAFSQTNADFIVTPYLQIGSTPTPQSLHLLWQAAKPDAVWLVEYKNGSGKWMKAKDQATSKITTAGVEPYTVYNAAFTALEPGTLFAYRVSKNGKLVFTAKAKAPKSAAQPFRFIASGDMGAGTREAIQIANGIYKANPDFVAFAGDLVYEYGLVSEYKTKFWPIYNAEKVTTTGVPLMRSTLFVGAVGNHDVDTKDMDRYPDALAYYLFWDQPLNGPLGQPGGAFVPALKASDANRKAFTEAAGSRYPRMANFSFDYGNAHWTVLDADTYVDWTDSTLQAWVAEDLAKSKNATWHFVLYHHPGFSSAKKHFEQQHMRLLAPIFEKGNVDIVFNGHVHNYQRSFPIHFKPDSIGTQAAGGKDNKTLKGRIVNGAWDLDKTFDGKRNTKPNGVIYIVSGAGGQTLYNPEQQTQPDTWQKFTTRFISTIHSFTQVDINGKTLKLSQVDVNGKEVDGITITK